MLDKSKLIVAKELEKLLEASAVRLIDCRFKLAEPLAGRRDFLEGHIPGAVFLDLEQDLSGPVGPATGRHPLPDAHALARRLGELGISNDDAVVVYDEDNGAMAARCWWVLRWLGHNRARLLDGGLGAWRRSALALARGETTVPATSFIARVRQELVVTTQELARDPAAIPELCLIDVRDAPRYRGEVEPIDPVAGHIPGAVNLPFTLFLNADGTWRDAQARQELLQQSLGEDRTRSWMVMCGSGVTACHLALAGVDAGYREPRVYVGSWSEWIRDPSRPRAVAAP